MSSALSGCKLELDYSEWRSVFRNPPNVGRVVMVLDRLKDAVYLAAIRIDEEGKKVWKSMEPLKFQCSYYDPDIFGWMPKDQYLKRFKSCIQR